MTTMNLDLYFKEQASEHFPAHPVAQIFVKTFTGHTYPDANGVMFVSAQCISYSELDHAVSVLEKELKEIRAKAKKKFSKK